MISHEQHTGTTVVPASRLSGPAVSAATGDHRISVVIPARNVERTIAAVISAIHPYLADEGPGLVDEVIVVDDGSTDATVAEARTAGAQVLSIDGDGKGGAMAAGVDVAAGDIIVFLDGDVANMRPDYLPRLTGPLLLDPNVMLVKGHYARSFEGATTGGGRVTELAARPILGLLFPELAAVRQPLAGETALRREVIETCGLDHGYRVEIGLLIDVWRTWGIASIAEVDLGLRIHRNRPLDQLGPMAAEVLAAALERSGIAPQQP